MAFLADHRPSPLMQIGQMWKRAVESFQRKRCSSVVGRIALSDGLSRHVSTSFMVAL
jgi:hypothetical protein